MAEAEKKRIKGQYLIRCLAKGCAAKAGPIEDKDSARIMAIEHAAAFKHPTEIHVTKVLRSYDPANLPRMMR